MDPQLISVQRGVARDVDQIGTYVPVPGLGVLPVNAFVLRAREPMLIDAGVALFAEQTLAAIREAIDLSALRYVYLTHADPDHVGCLREVLAEAPRAMLVTTVLGMGKLGLTSPVAPERVIIKNPGESLELGDRRVVVGRPPLYDAPETTWLYERGSDVLFSSDCFGAVLPRPFESAGQIAEQTLREGLITWAGIDAPWFASQDRVELRRRVRDLHAPATILGAHLPPADGMSRQLLECLLEASSSSSA